MKEWKDCCIKTHRVQIQDLLIRSESEACTWNALKEIKTCYELEQVPEIANTREGQMGKQTNSAPPANFHFNGIGTSKAKLQLLVQFQLSANGRPICHNLQNLNFY